MTQHLTVMRGLPASGKTTVALKQYVEGRGDVRVCRDDIRMMLQAKTFLDYEGEQTVTLLEEAMVREALKAHRSVVVDATHLRPKYVRKWAKVAREFGVGLNVHAIPCTIEESIERNEARRLRGGRYVPVEAIQSMRRFLGKGELLQPVDLTDLEEPTIRRYEPRLDKPDAIVVDIDGTLAHMNGRGPYDLHRVGEDRLDVEVRQVVRWAVDEGWQVILLSGREDSVYLETTNWLRDHDVMADELYMRPADDKRKDSIVKAELFDTHVRDRFNVRFVLDDRNQVVEMWRAMGLKCFQVAEGNF